MSQDNGNPHVPPQNLEAEESVLGAMLVTGKAIESVFVETHLLTEDFYRESHRVIFEAVKDLFNRSEPVDALTVAEYLAQRGQLDEAGGRDTINLLAANVPVPGNARHYAEIVRQNSLLRRLLGAAQTIQASIYGHDGEPKMLVEQAERLLFQVAHSQQSADFRKVSEILIEEVEKLEKLAQGDGSLTGTPSGFRDLDNITGGFQPGNLVIIAARPAMGKCLVGDSLVFDPETGRASRLEELVARFEDGAPVRVATVGTDLALRGSSVKAVHRNGRKRVFSLVTRRGRSVTATANHPFLTAEGWKPLEHLLADDLVAIPRGVSSSSGVEWEAIDGIEDAGSAETYDLTVPGTHNFVADDVIVHNSTLVANFAENVSSMGRPVAFFSLEMSETELAHRFIACKSGISSDKLRKGQVSGNQWPKVLKACNELEKAPLWIDESSDLGMLDLRAKARRLHAQEKDRGGLGMIIVDYIQLMRAEDPRSNRVEQVGQMSRGLKILARELNVPVMGLSQLSRAPEQRPDKRPILSDLRESGCLAGDTRVYLPATGGWKPIGEMVGGRGVEVLGLNRETQRLERCSVTNAFSTGIRPTFMLRTRLGREIRATANHKFLTVDGWSRLDCLALGERVATSEVDWDQIASIEPAGETETFDLTVDPHHNFVAADMIVHNSIEQDADVVAFIYRDEVYNDDAEEGAAELLISKHRNGPIGKVDLVFRAQYPKFMSRARTHGQSAPPAMEEAA